MTPMDQGGPAQPRRESDLQRARMLGLLRVLFAVLLVMFTAMLILRDSLSPGGGWQLGRAVTAIAGMLLLFFGFLTLDILTPKRKLSTISAVFVGLIAGVLVTAILGAVIDVFTNIYGLGDQPLFAPIKVMLGLGICYLTVSTVLQTQDDFRLVIPYIEFSRKIRGPRPLVIDSSALIDGRVLDVAESGLFQSPLVVPRFIIEELQRLSDSGDRLKRARGRRGLEMVSRLQRSARAEVSIDDSTVAGASADQMLVELARLLPATIVTTDLGLSRVAAIQGLPTLNINDLAAALKPSVIPGEPLALELLRKGEQPGQAVGYLQDGTMVVVDDAEHLINEFVTVSVTSTMQTSAGRLIFGRLPDDRRVPPAAEPAHTEAAVEPEAPGTGEPRATAPRPSELDSSASAPGAPAAEPLRPAAGGPARPAAPHDRPGRSLRNPRRS